MPFTGKEIRIRITSSTLAQRVGVTNQKSSRRSIRRLFKKSHKRLMRYALLSANIALLVGVFFFVTNGQSSSEAARQNAVADATTESIASPLDQLSSADIAVHVAKLTSLPESQSVVNHADSFNEQLTTVTSADETIVAKPQIVADAAVGKSRKDIKSYTTKDGDTVSSVAQQFGVTSDSIRWSNGIAGDRLTAGRQLTIPPVSGIVYTVKAGDTVDTLAQKYSVSKEKIIEFNDLELTGIKQGDKIVLQDGVQPAVRSSVSNFAWNDSGFTAVYSANGYDYGWCTWWAAKRRADIGRPIPSNLGNAATWASRAARAGLAVDARPAAGSVAFYRTIGGLGHVGFVEQVNDDGSVWISDMNYFGVSQIGGSSPAGGWGRTSYHLVPVGDLGSYLFID